MSLTAWGFPVVALVVGALAAGIALGPGPSRTARPGRARPRTGQGRTGGEPLNQRR
ncbi:hypothetical protein [Streptomyces sp. NPDC088755]|uniref:hypothetical protein n=1 Tax=Streptomyces sp. NPDC088755 TaxID=3365888 RepID=UPI003828A1C7